MPGEALDAMFAVTTKLAGQLTEANKTIHTLRVEMQKMRDHAALLAEGLVSAQADVHAIKAQNLSLAAQNGSLRHALSTNAVDYASAEAYLLAAGLHPLNVPKDGSG